MSGSITSWKSLKNVIHPTVLKAVDRFNFQEMTAVQTACIPQLVNYKDVAAEAVTGSGKTLAFLVPVLHLLMRREEEWKPHEIGAVIIAPTRELAHQIKEVLSVLLEEEGLGKLKHLLFIGGTPIQTDVDSFRNEGANIVIATPGRLEDLLLRREDSRIAQSVKSLEVLILDEADCLLNLGFEKSLDTILRLLPKQRRTGLFSATQTTEVIKLIRAGLRNPVSIVVRDNDNQGRVPAKLANYYYTVEPEKKFTLLIEFLKQEKSKKVLIFFSTCACVEYFSMVLPRILQCSGGVSNVKSIHGKMKEKHRFAIFNKFRESETGIMCCTDVMARGIDITQKIDWVVQYDPPSHPASFIHRAGRTARNGDEGQALLLLLPSEIDYIDFIKVSQKVDVDRLSLERLNPSEDQVQQLNKSLKRFQMKDRKYYDKAMRAFVSYYKAYTKYECHLILRHKDLPLSRVAESFGLLKFPKMSEMHGKKPDDFQEVDVDINKLQYGDKLQEKARQKNLTVYKQTGEWPEGKSGGKKKKSAEKSSWATSKEKRVKKKEKKITRKRKRNALTVEEFEELEKDDALVKKLKRKKITEADFDEEIGLVQDD